MAFWGYRFAPAAYNVKDGWHLMTSIEFNLKHVIAFANHDIDNCNVETIEFLPNEPHSYKVHLKDFKREYIHQKLDYKFHLIYSTAEGKLYKQTVRHRDRIDVGPPIEIVIGDYSVSSK